MRQYIWIDEANDLLVIARDVDSKKVRAFIKRSIKSDLESGVITSVLYDHIWSLITGSGNLVESVKMDPSVKQTLMVHHYLPKV